MENSYSSFDLVLHCCMPTLALEDCVLIAEGIPHKGLHRNIERVNSNVSIPVMWLG
jgi:hypothetical protein